MRLTREKFWRGVAAVLSILALGGVVWSFQIWDQYWERLPRAPDRAAGRIYPENFHGVIIYENDQERFRLHAIQNSAYGSFGLAVVISVLCDWKWPRKDKFSMSSGRPYSRKS
jgi:hypothetical protein